MTVDTQDLNEAYRQTQSQIYGLQETILNSTRKGSGNKDDQSLRSENTNKIAQRNRGETDGTVVSSKHVLEYVQKKYGSVPANNLGTLCYHPYKEGEFEDGQRKTHATISFPYNLFELSMPQSFLPGFGEDKIHSLITVKVLYDELLNSFQNVDCPRTLNNEIWGCQIYTDDSDPLLVLRHCGLSISDYNGMHRTPANLQNDDNVEGTIPPKGTPFDLEITLLLLPSLQSYPSVKQYGITSRQWGVDTPIPHDGLSYGIYGIRIIARDTSTKNIDSRDYQVDTLKW